MRRAPAAAAAAALLALALAGCVDIAPFPEGAAGDGGSAGSGGDGAAGGAAPPPFAWPTACVAAFPDAAAVAPTPRFARAFTGAPKREARALRRAPDGRMVMGIAEAGSGEVRAFDGAGGDALLHAQAVADVPAGGLVDVAFHPGWPEQRWAYLSFVEGPPLRLVVARFAVAIELTFDAGSALRFIEIDLPTAMRHGGALDVGPDGLLYVGVGDGGAEDGAAGAAQDPTTPLGAVLRMDAATGEAPPDNPAPAAAGAARFVWAHGVRDPRGLRVDGEGGAVWLAEGGDADRLVYGEINVPVGGANLGWGEVSGDACVPGVASPDCDPADFAPPAVALPWAHQPDWLHPRPVGGAVYRGAALPALYGAYVYYDNVRHSFYAYRLGEDGPPGAPIAPPDGVDGLAHRALALGPDGELVLQAGWEQELWTLAPAPGSGAALPAGFPAALWGTGCLQADAAGRYGGFAEGVLALQSAAGQWQDHARVERHLALPEGGQLTPAVTGAWKLPVGSLLFQTFVADVVDAGGAVAARPIETRVLARATAGWQGYAYRWGDDGRDATLLPSGDTRALTVRPADGGAPVAVRWRFPSRAQCATCHAKPGGGGMEPLGLTTAALAVPGQVEGWAAAGLLAGAPAPALALADLRALPAEAAGADLEHAARSWLHVQCASCHRPGKTPHLTMDLSITAPFSQLQLCGVTPARGRLGVAGAALLAPGAPEASVLWLRLAGAAGPHRMPALSGETPDAAAMEGLRRWIAERTGCDDL